MKRTKNIFSGSTHKLTWLGRTIGNLEQTGSTWRNFQKLPNWVITQTGIFDKLVAKFDIGTFMKKRLGHIFLVDDNHDMRFYLSDMLILLGYTVDTFDNASAFLEKSMDISPAVVLLDMRMPGLNGLELQAKLDALGRKTPIIFISGESDKDEIIEAFRLGAVDFLLKPFNREKLCQVVDKALEMDRQRNQEFVNTDALRRSFATLSTREQEIFMLIVQGLTNKGIAEVTGIQPGTAKKHRATIYQKFEVNTSAELIGQCKGVDLSKLAQVESVSQA
jgi:FixJ family two-component response regulator